MKRLALLLAVTACLSWTAGSVRAQEEPQPPGPKKKVVKERPKPKKPLLRGTHAQMAKVCELSEEQQKKIAELEAERRKELKPLAEKTKAAKTALAEARKTKDKDAIKKANEGMRAANAAYQGASKKWWQEILGVLSQEQRAKWYEHVVMNTVKGRFKAANLTDDQLEKIKAAYLEHTTGVDLADDKARGKAIAKLSAHITKSVLTPEQREALVVGTIKRQYRKIKLTDQQLEKIQAAYAEHTKGVDPADEKAWRAASKKLSDHVHNQILTEEQRQAMKPKKKPGPEKKADKPKPKPAEKPAQEPAEE